MNILKLTQNYLAENVVSQAEKLDRDSAQLKQVLQDLGKLHLLALKVPQALGGSGLSAVDYAKFQILVARYSGAVAFLQTQHQSAASMIAASGNQMLQKQYLPKMKTGTKLVGVGFSHLRRPGKPMVQAVEVAEGYLISGEVPWITGFGFFDNFIVGANLPDSSEIYGLLPFQGSISSSVGNIEFSEPLELIAMNSSNTVTAKLDNWLLTKDLVISIKPPGSIHSNSRKNTLKHSVFALGCACAALDIVERVYQKKQLEFIQQSWQALSQEVKSCEQKILDILESKSSDYKSKLQVRSQAIHLAQRCSQAAVIVSSGAANQFNNAAGRVYREALMFSVFGQTTDVMQITLEQLI